MISAFSQNKDRENEIEEEITLSDDEPCEDDTLA
jgi:hypothetical protein